MHREPVKSSSIKSVGYDDASETLEIEFRNGPRVYQYYGVPRQDHIELMTAESKGTFVNKIIKSYPWREIMESHGSKGLDSR
jgi:hypothetical protein